MKIAKLVCVSLMTRVIVEENATEEEIMELAIPKLSESLMDAPFENIEYIKDDIECPFGISVEDIKKMELIGEDVFLNEDADESNPVSVLADGNDTEESPIRIYTFDNNDTIRVFGLTKPQSVIEVENRDVILNYCLSKVTPEDEVSLIDIFMQREFIFEIK